MLNFFAILLIIFIVFLLLIFKKRQFKNAINFKKLSSNKLINNNKNNKNNISKKNSFSYKHEDTIYSEFDKKALRNTMFKLFQSHKEDKLKALKIAEKLADKSILPILRRGLKDTSPEVVEISANLIRNFK
tara:strand:+ start:52 stop:444 length:393 start_codon:yes stop_codon:yes gene_type:complete